MAKSSADVIMAPDKGRDSIELPDQRVSRKTKLSPKWQEDTLDHFINNRRNSYRNRKTSAEIRADWDFYNSNLSSASLHDTLDPLGVEKSFSKSSDDLAFKFYNILDQPFDTLFGEELKRHSEVKAYVVNPNIINEKDREFQGIVKKFLAETAESTDKVDELAFQEKMKEFDKFKKNDLQTAHEKMANQMIQVVRNDSNLNTKMTFNQGFKNLEIIGEEIFRVGHVGKELSFTKVNSENFYVLGLGYSPYIQDAYAWIEEDRLTANKIIEEFSEELTNAEIDRLLKYTQGPNWLTNNKIVGLTGLNPDEDPGLVDPHNPSKTTINTEDLDDLISIDGTDNDPHDTYGNIRVYRIQWLALRKLGKLKYYDEFGDELYDWVDEEYKVDISQGEEVEWIWVNELWEGTRIGNDIYKKIRPCPVQMRSMINPSIVKPSYVGYVMSNNGVVQKSRMDKLKPYQEMYNVWANKLVKLWTEHIGKVAQIDVASIPAGMSTEEWYLWAKRFNFAFYNSFEEGKKGAAKGMIAGNMQQRTNTLDLSLAEDINQAIQTLSWIEERVNKISAVPEARQGATSGREGLGVTQQAITSSSHQTEVDFAIHDLLKSKCYEVIVEYLKVLWKDEKGKRQYLLDDLSNFILDIDGEVLNEAEYGVKITNSSQLYSMYQAMQQLSHAAMQNGMITMSDIAKMYMATSPSQIVHGLEEAEDNRMEQQNEQAKMAQQTAQQQMQMQQQLSQMQHQQELEKINLEYQYKLQIEQLKAQYKANEHATDNNQNHIEDQVELDKIKLQSDADKEILDKKLSHEEKLKQMDIQSKERIEQKKLTSANKKKTQ